MRVDDERVEMIKRINAAIANATLAFTYLGSAVLGLSISIAKCSEILAENAERLKGYEQGSD